MFIFLEPSSPRTRDLIESGEYCLHCAMSDSSGSSGEFQVTGVAIQIADPAMRELAEPVSSFRPALRSVLFELQITEAMSTAYRGGQPKRRRWHSGDVVVEFPH